LLGITIFVCSLVITRLVGKDCCDDHNHFTDPFYSEHFGSMFRTAFTLLQFTMEFQPDLCRRTWEDGIALTLFFIVYTCFTNLTLLNIIASIIVDRILTISYDMNAEAKARAEAEKERKQRQNLKAIFDLADFNGDGVLTLEELTQGPPCFTKSLECAGIHILDATECFEVLDPDRSGTVSLDEFTECLLRVRKPPQAKHLLQIERRLVDLDLKANRSMQEVVSLLDQLVNPGSQQGNPLKTAKGITKVPDCFVVPQEAPLPDQLVHGRGHHGFCQKTLTSVSVSEVRDCFVVSQDMTNKLQMMLRSEMQDWCYDVRHFLQDYQSRLQQLQKKLPPLFADQGKACLQASHKLREGADVSQGKEATPSDIKSPVPLMTE